MGEVLDLEVQDRVIVYVHSRKVLITMLKLATF